MRKYLKKVWKFLKKVNNSETKIKFYQLFLLVFIPLIIIIILSNNILNYQRKGDYKYGNYDSSIGESNKCYKNKDGLYCQQNVKVKWFIKR